MRFLSRAGPKLSGAFSFVRMCFISFIVSAVTLVVLAGVFIANLVGALVSTLGDRLSMVTGRIRRRLLGLGSSSINVIGAAKHRVLEFATAAIGKPFIVSRGSPKTGIGGHLVRVMGRVVPTDYRGLAPACHNV